MVWTVLAIAFTRSVYIFLSAQVVLQEDTFGTITNFQNTPVLNQKTHPSESAFPAKPNGLQ